MSLSYGSVMTVLDSRTALFAALKFLPEGTKMTVYTHDPGKARTNIVAELRKEPGGGWHDWQILKRPATADSSLLPATWPSESPAVVSSQDLAETFANDPNLWATVHDE